MNKLNNMKQKYQYKIERVDEYEKLTMYSISYRPNPKADTDNWFTKVLNRPFGYESWSVISFEKTQEDAERKVQWMIQNDVCSTKSYILLKEYL